MGTDIFFILLSAFLIGFFSATVAAGPVGILIFRTALLGRYKKCIPMVIGSLIMETIYCGIALGVVGAVLLQGPRIMLFSKVVGAIIFFFIGIYLYKTDPNKEVTEETKEISLTEKTKSFLTGFLLVALNPSIILVWSAIITALISFDIISFRGYLDIFFFILSAAAGLLLGSAVLIVLAKSYKKAFSTLFFKRILQLTGIVFVGVSLYSILRVILHLLDVI